MSSDEVDSLSMEMFPELDIDVDRIQNSPFQGYTNVNSKMENSRKVAKKSKISLVDYSIHTDSESDYEEVNVEPGIHSAKPVQLPTVGVPTRVVTEDEDEEFIITTDTLTHKRKKPMRQATSVSENSDTDSISCSSCSCSSCSCSSCMEVDTDSNTDTDSEDTTSDQIYVGGGGCDSSSSSSILKYIDVLESNVRILKKFQYQQRDYTIALKKNIKNLPTVDLVGIALNEMFEFGKSRSEFREGDLINLVVQNPGFGGRVISTGYDKKDHVKTLKEKLEQIVTSDQTVDLLQCKFSIQTVHLPRGGKGSKIINLKEDVHTKKSINVIKDFDDNLCGLRAVIVGLTHHTNMILGRQLTDSEIKMTRSNQPIQTILTLKLYCLLIEKFGKDCISTTHGMTIDDFKYVEELLDVQIYVVEAIANNPVIRKGQIEKDVKIFLYKNGEHYDTINKMAAFYGSSYFCHKCCQVYNNKDRVHTCKEFKAESCFLCRGDKHQEMDISRVLCEDCNRYCLNSECLKIHKETVCPYWYRCEDCNQLVSRKFKSEHECGYGKCLNCKEKVHLNTHQCYMVSKQAKGGKCENGCKRCEPDAKKKDNKKCTYTEKYIYFDYECRQETGEHIPNLVIAHDFQGKEFIFKTNEDFCAWLIHRLHKNYTAIAHYARGYDTHFILQYCIKNTIKPNVIYSGSKIMELKIENINLRIIDSNNFVQSALAEFPATFGLEELKKGYFPHYFNTLENASYVGPIPNKETYNYDHMKEKERKKFIKWHDARIAENYIFDFQKEIVEYCRSDVDILRRGCLKLRTDFMNIANIDPFQYITIASVCMAIYRSKYLPPKSIAVQKKEFTRDQYSDISISWLQSFDNENIAHALNGGEVTICGAKVDGFDMQTNTIYQFHGCYFHGCSECYFDDTMNRTNHKVMGDLFQKTKDRTKQLENAGYNVVEMWQCKWMKTAEYRKNKETRFTSPLNPRDAFFGGRTEAFKLKKEVDGRTEKIRYVDVCSLYPTVMYYDDYPVGHPTKIMKPAAYDPTWFGFIKCKVLPPKNLYIPVLPVRVQMKENEKLLFPLCLRCAANSQRICSHNDCERELTGTWSTIEVTKALQVGYKVLEIYEVWNFDKSKDLWKGYIADFLKIKLESSKHSYATKEAYADANQKAYGITLDLNEIALNPGKRAVAKLCLNSLWGKFGQRDNMGCTEFITDPIQLFKLLLDDALKVNNVLGITEEMVQVDYKFKDQFLENNFNTNIYVAAFTTANARLRLYDLLSKLDNAVLYCDTDSIIYIDNGLNTVKTGDLLGQWTDELGDNDFHIEKFLSIGPKSYYYRTNKRDEETGEIITEMKMKGFTLDHTNAKVIQGDAMEQLIEGERQQIMTIGKTIIRDKETKNLLNKDQEKKLVFGFDKRVIINNFDTTPYGFITN